MDRNMKKLLCVMAAVLLLTGCRRGGGETTAPAESLPPATTAPAVTLPQGEGVEDWDDPIDTTPIETTGAQPGTTQPAEGSTEPSEDPTQPPLQNTEPPVQNTDPTEPKPTDPPAPPETTQPQAGGADPADLTYEEYLAMSSSEQQAHYEQFPNLDAYIAWHNAALAEYEENQSSIEVTGGIDIGDFMNP